MSKDYERKVIINKAITDREHYFFQNNLEAFNEAINKLHSVGAIKLFFYLSKNKNKYSMTLNEVEFCEWANENETSFEKGFKELVDNKYLIENIDNEGNSYNLYNFYDYDYNREDLRTTEENKKKNNNVMFYYNFNIGK